VAKTKTKCNGGHVFLGSAHFIRQSFDITSALSESSIVGEEGNPKQHQEGH
jgi:hypothetical protein